MGRLSLQSRLLILLAAVLLLAAFFTPLWSIQLVAPQYPEGMGMYIWINQITGHAAFDLKNINLLNHYVGMAAIAEESIPELQLMPYILGYMILGALVTVFFARRIMVYLGLVNLALVGSAGFFDFWRWGHNYGHNLNPEAPISIPGMTYQPPLLGCKELLNITSCSWPHTGCVLLLIVGAILLGILVFDQKPGSLLPGFIPRNQNKTGPEGAEFSRDNGGKQNA